MDGDFASKLKTVLSDPEAMAKISEIASGLGGVPKEQTVNAEEPQKTESEPSFNAFSNLSQSLFPAQSDPAIALLSSLKPLLREEKRDRVDSLIKALAVAAMMKNFRK